MLEVPKKLSKEQKNLLKQLDQSLSDDKNYNNRKSFADKLKKAFGKDTQ